MNDLHQQRWREIERIFDEALEHDDAERTAFLQAACAGDEMMRSEVETLLLAHQKAQQVTGGFLASPLGKTNGTTKPSKLGSYQLMNEIARGGMGTVWLAHRADQQFQQQVAIKLIHAGADREDILRRFQHERQILADLNHPNIARLLDGGTTEEGRPYFVMEYIEGLPIDEYCQQHQLSVRERLQLFRQVCTAVQYAHQNLILHRDLKPGNILVTADGTPKLLDFGVAKLLQPDLTASHSTQSGVTPMTPAYASPEQVRGEKLTTASDVYSLGVVLYELLTGRSPYRLKENSFGELSRAICEQEPERPSTTAGMKDEGEGMNKNRKFSSLIPHPSSLRGDVDSIVLMALRKEPHLRYSSVEQLSDDIRRYLEGLPTLARKGTFAYRAVKYVRRHKVPVAAAALILLSLLGGIGATSRQAQIARAEQAKAEAQRIRAEQALAEVEAQRTRAENALTTAEERRQQAEAARTEANQQRTAAEEERNVAQTQRKLADEQRQRAEGQELSNRQLLYTSRMGLAHQAWENSNIGRMRELLDFYLPQADEPDFRGFDWYYLWRLCHREEKTITGGDFNGVAYSPDGKTLLTLAITLNNSSYIAEVAFRDAANWQILSSKQYSFSRTVGTVAVSRNTDKVVVGLNSDSIRVFSFSDYKEHLQIGGLGLLKSVAISPSGKLIAAGSERGKIQLFDATTGKEIRSLVGHQQQINTVAFSPDEQLLVSGGFDETVRLWDVRTGNEIRVIKQSASRGPNSATFTADGNAVIAACNRELKVWETATGREIATRPMASGRPVLALSRDGKVLATADSQPVIRLWDTQNWQEKAAIKGHGNMIRSLAFSPHGNYLASGSRDQTARIWNLSSNVKDIITLTDTEAQAGFSNARFTPDGQKIISVTPRAGMASVWDRISGRKLLDLRGHTKPATEAGFFLELAVSSDSRLIATGGMDKLVKIWEAETGREISTINVLPGWSTALAFSPNNRFLAVGTFREARIYDLAQGRDTIKINVPLGNVSDLSFISDGKILVTASDDSIIRFWDTATGQELRRIQCNQNLLFAMTLSANDKYFATGGLDGTAAIWDVQTSDRIWLLKGHSSSVNGVSFSPDGKRLATSSNDNTVKLWDLITGQELLTLKEAGGCSVAFSPDGRQLLAACGNNLTIWPAATEQEVGEKKD